MCLDDKIILDIQRIASLLNTNKLSFDEYVAHGGKFEKQIIENEYSSFGNYCELAGIKRYSRINLKFLFVGANIMNRSAHYIFCDGYFL